MAMNMAIKNSNIKNSLAGSAFSFKLRADGVGLIEINIPGEAQNTLKAEFGEQFEAALAQVKANPQLKGLVVCSTKPGSFLAGADLSLFDRVVNAAEVAALSLRCQAAFQQVQDLPIPVIAAIDGACLGGGLELALACHVRIATDCKSTVLGLPEAMLGLLPAGGGTQRLPRLIGIAKALDLMLSGKQLRPAQSKKLGILDTVVPAHELIEAAAARVIAISDGKTPACSDKTQSGLMHLALEGNAVGRSILFSQARKQLLAKTRGNYPAQERIITVVETGYRKGLKAGYAAEAQAFGELALGEVSKQLRGIFFAQTALKKETFVGDKSVQARAFSKVGVLGAGLMGAGIALVSVSKAGVDVRLKDKDTKGVANGLSYLRRFYDQRVARKTLSRAVADTALSRVTGTSDYSSFGDCDIVVEAVFEDLKLKHQMLKDVEVHCATHTIFATNTSSIPIIDIAKAAQRPENVIGMHYFSPVEKMPMLEIITTAQTAPEVIATAVAFGKAQGKTVIVVKDGPGFYTTRILAPYLNEAARILAEGVDPHDVDKALMDYGYPIGPITLLDEVGIDVGVKVAPVLTAAFGERMAPPSASTSMIEAGFLGRKTGKGFYLYEGQKKGSKPANGQLNKLLGARPGNKMDAVEIAERCAYMQVNEAAYCLQEGILADAMHGDIGAIFGLGFPPFRGGPFRLVDSVGAKQVVARLNEFAVKYGSRFTPAPILRDMAKNDRRFYG
jgi:3-hydroxyacyl-CoA dehydrogenase/enoyl-CoA hydratase/3-hydroxybutyryl-CoA epimerase